MMTSVSPIHSSSHPVEAHIVGAQCRAAEGIITAHQHFAGSFTSTATLNPYNMLMQSEGGYAPHDTRKWRLTVTFSRSLH